MATHRQLTGEFTVAEPLTFETPCEPPAERAAATLYRFATPATHTTDGRRGSAIATPPTSLTLPDGTSQRQRDRADWRAALFDDRSKLHGNGFHTAIARRAQAVLHSLSRERDGQAAQQLAANISHAKRWTP